MQKINLDEKLGLFSDYWSPKIVAYWKKVSSSFFIVPKGVEYMPEADEEERVLLLEPKAALNTGNVRNERTVEAQWI